MSGQAVVAIRDKQWNVFLALTSQEIHQGLNSVESIPPYTGMYFNIGCPGTFVSVTTQNMLFPLDIAFLDGEAVVDIARNVPPGIVVTSGDYACSFLEVNAGELLGIEVGDLGSIVTTEAPLMPPPPSPVPPTDLISSIMPLIILMMMFMMMGNMFRPAKPSKVTVIPPSRALAIPPTRTIMVRGQIGRVVTVPGGSSWRCSECGKKLVPGEKVVKVASKTYCTACVRKYKQEEYYADTEASVQKSGFMFETQLDYAFTEAIRRAKR